MSTSAHLSAILFLRSIGTGELYTAHSRSTAIVQAAFTPALPSYDMFSFEALNLSNKMPMCLDETTWLGKKGICEDIFAHHRD
jgi:hypothetical protein